MFESLEMAPADPILGLSAAFREDPNPAKINLGVGEYRDTEGKTPILQTVKEVEAQLLRDETSKSYLDIAGSPEYGAAVRTLLFGADNAAEPIPGHQAITLQTPGGTGALRLAGDFIHRHYPGARIWLSDPTWANHPKIFEAAGVEVRTYPYFDTTSNELDFAGLKHGLEQDLASGDVVLLHGCCHNPSGADPSTEQWRQIGETLASRGAIPFVDFAYQGFGDGLEADAQGFRALMTSCPELLIASSFSKNFALYKERVGALTLVAPVATTAPLLSQLKICVRTNFSNPPAHGAAIVVGILHDPDLRQRWEGELASMRERINGMRTLYVQTLKEKGVGLDFSFIERQRGMFSFSGLNKDQVGQLRDRFAIYIVGSGRINVAAITPANVDGLCEAIARVL
jgi:aspartate/tyrosine/aromatic aminotransferase